MYSLSMVNYTFREYMCSYVFPIYKLILLDVVVSRMFIFKTMVIYS